MKVIYIRTSTNEQTPELQLKDISSIINIEECQIFKDQQSAYKDNVEREAFIELKSQIIKNKISDIYVWDLDRLFRNRKKLIAFFELCKNYKCKIHSVRQQWLEQINTMPEPWNEIIHGLMLQIMGWLNEEESAKKSERIKNAVKKKNGKTISYKGKKWGRKEIEIDYKTKLLIQEELKNYMSIRYLANKYNVKKHIVEKIKKEINFTNKLHSPGLSENH